MTQAFHPLEYRHGPISLVDNKTAAYSADQKDAGKGSQAQKAALSSTEAGSVSEPCLADPR
ncbi:hypothetical protein [Agrobacterium burrii]